MRCVCVCVCVLCVCVCVCVLEPHGEQGRRVGGVDRNRSLGRIEKGGHGRRIRGQGRRVGGVSE